MSLPLASQITIYQTAEGKSQIDVRFEQETVWLTQRQMSEVFDTTPENVLMHLKNIYKDNELDEMATAKEFLAVRSEGKVEKTISKKIDRRSSLFFLINSR